MKKVVEQKAANEKRSVYVLNHMVSVCCDVLCYTIWCVSVFVCCFVLSDDMVCVCVCVLLCFVFLNYGDMLCV